MAFPFLVSFGDYKIIFTEFLLESVSKLLKQNINGSHLNLMCEKADKGFKLTGSKGLADGRCYAVPAR